MGGVVAHFAGKAVNDDDAAFFCGSCLGLGKNAVGGFATIVAVLLVKVHADTTERLGRSEALWMMTDTVWPRAVT